MPGSFIVSLDCEGKWGMADKIGPEHGFITEASLTEAYARLLAAFGRHGVPATFAFVGAFVLDEAGRRRHRDLFRDIPYEGRNWLRNYRLAEAAGALDGWFCPAALDMALEGGHEIASHGFSHVPFDDPATPDADLAADIEAAVEVGRARGVPPRTFVYPRNRVGRTRLLAANGFGAYRTLLPGRGQILKLLREFNVLERSQPDGTVRDGLLEIPAGYFLNWRQGIRRRVPRAVTRARWSSVLGHAARTGGVAHLWLHPHNIISAPETLGVLDRILGRAARLRDAGDLLIETQADYLDRLAGTS